MAATLNAATFMGKNFSTIQSFVKNFEDLTLKQMFDVTAQLVNNQAEINGLDKILWGKNSWTRLRFCVVSRRGSSTSRIQRSLEEQNCRVQSGKCYRDYDAINGESTEFEWNIFPGLTTLHLCGKINDLLSNLRNTSNFHRKNFIYVNVQWHLL